MIDAFIQLGLFTAKSFIIVLVVALILLIFFMLLANAKQKTKGRLNIRNLNKKYIETTDELLVETLPKKQLKKALKERKAIEKEKEKATVVPPNVYVLNFMGDAKASAVSSLREEITAVLNIATPKDEVVVRLESGGGFVHSYGLAAAQLMRVRSRNIPLTVTVDKVAASGGYLMASVANKILSAPFAIIGSIGVLVQMPNFHRLLKDKHIDFEQLMAGDYKRTLTLFGENTEEGRQKLQHEIEDVHQLFKNAIVNHRPQVDIQKVATGEHWLGQQAIDLKLVDEIQTSDDYLMERSKHATVFEVSFEVKKPFLARLSATASAAQEKLFMPASIY